jgi:LL-diaminopimelate aminotransferase
MPAPAHRLSNLPTYVFASIGDRIRSMQQAGVKVIRLDIGSPDAPPPMEVVEALHAAAARPGTHGYAGYRGLPAFREAVARYYQRRFGVTVNPNTEVLPLIGSKEGIVNLCLAYLDRGDLALIPDVGYPSYMQGVRLSGAEIGWVPVRPETNYEVDFDAIPAEQRRAKLIWVNYPNNPTGAVVGLDFYEKAVAFCRENDMLLASDNPYCEVTFDGYVAPSALQVPDAKDVTLEFVSLSKSHNMAGWRLGAAVGSAKAVETLLKIKSNIDSGHFNAIYMAGVHALDSTPQSWIDERNQTYQRRRNQLIEALPHIGLAADTPKASLYIWAKPTKMSASQYVEEALTEANVSLAPGDAYGPGGTDYVRFSVGVTDEEFAQALDQLKAWYAAKYA